MPAPTTLVQTIAPGAVLRAGAERSYRALRLVGGEPHVRRLDLVGDAVDRAPSGRRRSIVHLLHLTDMQIVDVLSPARMEFVESVAGRELLAPMLPAHRPYESLATHALDATLRTLRSLDPSPVTGRPVGLVVTTGDAIDNRQWNELTWFLALMEGGEIRPGIDDRPFDGVQAPEWTDGDYWRPDDVGRWGELWGFPAVPGLLGEASSPFGAVGAGLPWLGCFGNHEALVQGMAAPTAAVRALAVGSRKAAGPPPDFDPATAIPRFVREPEWLLSGPGREVVPDASRWIFTRRSFVEAHLRAGGSPAGHGFTSANLADGTAYYAYDEVPGVRLIVLDTSNPGGLADGSVGARQAAWLEARLAESHTRALDESGHEVDRGGEDRLVLVFSHHGLDTLGNDLALSDPFDADADADDRPRMLAAAVRSLLHRFPNVVAWVNGHSHEHRIVPRPDPDGRTSGFWEITTGAIMDWPVQSRLVELVDEGDGWVSVVSTVVDHAAPVSPDAATAPWRLASLHRELAANDPHLGADRAAAGGAEDRNAVLRWRRRLTGPGSGSG